MEKVASLVEVMEGCCDDFGVGCLFKVAVAVGGVEPVVDLGGEESVVFHFDVRAPRFRVFGDPGGALVFEFFEEVGWKRVGESVGEKVGCPALVPVGEAVAGDLGCGKLVVVTEDIPRHSVRVRW